MDIALIIAAGALVGCLLGLSWFAGSDAPFIPTKMRLIRKVLKIVRCNKRKKFYELGSGDGRVVLEAARLGATAYGLEQSLIRVLYSKYLAKKYRLSDKARFFHTNLFSKSYEDADLVYIYLLSKGVSRLESKLRGELKKGAIVITQTYHFPTWKPYEKLGSFWLYRR